MSHILWLLLYALETIAENSIQEFFDFGDSVLAVSLEKLDLEPNETTFLYVVRRNDEGAK